MMFDTADLTSWLPFLPSDFVFKIAGTPTELEGFWRLRRQVFCEEQRMFEGSDRDERDDRMIPIVCNSVIMGMEDQVVGAVRIEEREPGLWWGSRLCVDSASRRISHLSSSVALRNHLPPRWNSIGAGLIYKAVTTAHRHGCQSFLATVQHQNARFFERLHWKSLERLDLHGHPHVKMQADLEYYPPVGSMGA